MNSNYRTLLPRIPLLDITPKEMKTCVLEKAYTRMHILSRGKQINTMWHICTIEFCSAETR
jgi:hypothetical protein